MQKRKKEILNIIKQEITFDESLRQRLEIISEV